MHDVVIVGAGLGGASVGYFLAGELRVRILEQGAQPGAEASSQNAGMVRRLGEDPYERVLALRSHQWLSEPPSGFEDASRVTGAVLGLARDPHHLTDAVSHLRASGVQVTSVEPDDVPALRGARLVRCWHLPEERVADPHVLLTGFLRKVREEGGEISLRTPVRRLVTEGGRCVGVETPAETIRADRVVLATGAWSAALARTAGLERPLVPLRRSLHQSAPHPVSCPDHPWCWVDDLGVYVRPEAGGWLFSACDEVVDGPTEGPGSRGPVEAEERARAVDRVERVFPALGELTVKGGWTGLRTYAPDRCPVLGEDPALPGLWWAAGLGGFGVTCAPAVGETVAAWILGRTTPWLSPRSVSPGRPFLRRWTIRPRGDLHDVKLVSSEIS